MCARPVRHMRQWPQNRCVSAATNAPTSGWWTSGPTAAMRPATSCPNVIGNRWMRPAAHGFQS